MRRKFTALLALATTACSGWRVESGPVPDATGHASGRSASIRIHLKSGGFVDLMGAKLVGDSVVGYSRDGRPDFARRAFATSDVQSVSTYGIDGAKTATAVFLIGGASVALMYACVSSLSNI